MTDLVSLVHALRRPRLLIRAARFGLQDYNRSRSLKRLARTPTVPSPRGAVNSLLKVEAELEDARCRGEASYSVSRHIEVLIALISEARLMSRPGAA